LDTETVGIPLFAYGLYLDIRKRGRRSGLSLFDSSDEHSDMPGENGGHDGGGPDSGGGHH
jgi:hypothetical protein